MQTQLVSVSLLIAFAFINTNPTTESKLAPQTPTKILSYDIVESKVLLVLTGSDYETDSKKCLIRKENDSGNGFDQISDCENRDAQSGTDKCVRACSGNDNKITFNVLSPRTRFIYVYSGAQASDIQAKNNGGEVFGLAIPLLVNPSITVSIDTNTKKLTLAAKTCKKVACPIVYKGIQYAAGTMGDNCDSGNSANQVDFDLMIPHYEMICTNYPSFFYHMPNPYMKENIDIYKPQYYVTHKNVDTKTNYVLKFTNSFPSEICLFSIKDASTNAGEPTNEYASVCGGITGKKCYAPCDNVELTLAAFKPIVGILIQTRYHNLDTSINSIEGYKEKKYAIEELAAPNTLFSAETPVGITLNPSAYNSATGTDSVKFGTCALKHFPADKIRKDGGETTKCNNNQACGEVCETASVIQQLTAGKAYIIEITPTTITGHTDFKEYLYFRTQESGTLKFTDAAPSATDVTAAIKAVDGDVGSATTEPTCSYYVSIKDKNTFVEAECEDSNPCRGFCKDTKKLINLNPKTNYDIKVVSHKDYGIKIFENISTTWSTMTLSHRFLDKGFKVAGTLTSVYPQATCHYKIREKDGETLKDVYSCPAVVPPSPPVSPVTEDIAAPPPTSTQTEVAQESRLVSVSNLSGIKIARASNAEEENSTSTEPAITQSMFPPCSKPPLCSNIIISDGYEANKEYQVLATAVGRSEEVTIDIPKNSLPEPSQDTNKQITVVIERVGDTLKITSLLPKEKDDNSVCRWILRDITDVSQRIVKKCDSSRSKVCKLPTCRSFTIEDVSDTNDYHLTLIHSRDPNVKGIGIIKRGETSNQSRASTSMIVGIIVPVAIVIVGVGFYFGYMKNKG